MSEAAGAARSQQEIQDWLVARLGQILEMDPASIDVSAPISQYGVDSSRLLEVAGELERWLGRKTDDELLQDNPDIQSLARQLAS